MVILDSYQSESQTMIRQYCDKRKKCVAMLALGQDEDINTDPEPETEPTDEHKFSLQVAWVNVKPSSAGHIIRVKCKNRQQTWLDSDKGNN